MEYKNFSERNEYANRRLQEWEVNQNPIAEFDKWFKNTVKHNVFQPDAFAVSSVSSSGKPSSRIVLLKEYSQLGYCFFSNYNSRKGIEFEHNSQVAALFYWAELEQQIRIEGTVVKLTTEKSDEYFASRSHESQIASIISDQSQVIENRELLHSKFDEYMQRNAKPLRPATWGGYCIVPDYFEFWQGAPHRLNDRICYEKQAAGWKIYRLAP